MDTSESLSHLISDQNAAKAGVTARCEAANFRWEPAVSDGRKNAYHSYIGNVSSHQQWQAEHKSYLNSIVHVPKDSPISAESFMPVNHLAHLSEELDNTFVLRLESIGHLLNHPLIDAQAEDFWQRFFNSPKDLRKSNLNDYDETILTTFVSQWNMQRTQARPLFATFLNDFGGNIHTLVKQDWPHTLRDQLGMVHWPSTKDNALPVALMCYTLDEVRQARKNEFNKKGATASFARPTVIDTEMSFAFIPAPLIKESGSFGHTLDLSSGGIPKDFTPELLTYPIEYKAHHIKALGFISRPHALDSDAAILQARNRHVQGLQALEGCAAFAEVLP